MLCGTEMIARLSDAMSFEFSFLDIAKLVLGAYGPQEDLKEPQSPV